MRDPPAPWHLLAGSLQDSVVFTSSCSAPLDGPSAAACACSAAPLASLHLTGMQVGSEMGRAQCPLSSHAGRPGSLSWGCTCCWCVQPLSRVHGEDVARSRVFSALTFPPVWWTRERRACWEHTAPTPASSLLPLLPDLPSSAASQDPQTGACSWVIHFWTPAS